MLTEQYRKRVLTTGAIIVVFLVACVVNLSQRQGTGSSRFPEPVSNGYVSNG